MQQADRTVNVCNQHEVWVIGDGLRRNCFRLSAQRVFGTVVALVVDVLTFVLVYNPCLLLQQTGGPGNGGVMFRGGGAATRKRHRFFVSNQLGGGVNCYLSISAGWLNEVIVVPSLFFFSC